MTDVATFSGVGKLAGTGRAVVEYRIDSLKMQRQIRDLEGKFIAAGGIGGPAYEAHSSMARVVQNRMIEVLKRQEEASVARQGSTFSDTDRPRLRGRTGERRLRAALDSAKNVVITNTTFRVGVFQWLRESPAAAYWAVLEYGADPNPSALISLTLKRGPRNYEVAGAKIPARKIAAPGSKAAGRGGAIVIPDPIPEYAYLRKGAEEAKEYLTHGGAQAIYNIWFDKIGLRLSFRKA